MTWIDFLLAGLAAVAAGLVNALAGGGTLITFPTLTALGISAVIANVTNTVALCPGYIGGILGQWKDLRDQMKRLWLVAPAGVIGGLIGGYLLLHTGEKLFQSLVPFLILLASALLAVQDPVRAWLVRRASQKRSTSNQPWMVGLPDWSGCDLRRIFRRRLERDRVIRIGLDDGRYFDAAQRLEASRFFQCQFCGGDFLFVFRESDLVGGAGDGGRRVDRRELGRAVGGARQARDLTLDRCDHRHCRCDHLFGATITIP